MFLFQVINIFNAGYSGFLDLAWVTLEAVSEELETNG